MSTIPSQEATAERAKLFAEFFNTMPVAALRDDVPAEMQKRIGAFMFSEGYRLVFDRWYLQAEPVKGVDHRTEREGWWVLEFRSIAVVEGEPGRIVSRELFPSREAADRAADDCEFSSRVIPLSDLLAACFAGGSPAKDVEAPAAIKEGWKLVPIEPTPAMIEAICAGQTSNATWPDDFNSGVQALRRAYAGNSWAGGLAAAPTEADT